eukprot:9215879-Ditylum_brightwellii.AAC.1
MACIVDYSILKQYYVRGIVVHGCGTHRDCRFDRKHIVESRGGCRSKNTFLLLFFMKIQFQLSMKALLQTQTPGWELTR